MTVVSRSGGLTLSQRRPGPGLSRPVGWGWATHKTCRNQQGTCPDDARVPHSWVGGAFQLLSTYPSFSKLNSEHAVLGWWKKGLVLVLFVFEWSLSPQGKDEMVGGCALPGPSLLVWVLVRSSELEPPHPEAGAGPRVSPADQPHIPTPQLERLSLCKFSEKPHVLLEQILGQLRGCWWGSCVELAGVGRPTAHSCKTAAHGAGKEGEGMRCFPRLEAWGRGPGWVLGRLSSAPGWRLWWKAPSLGIRRWTTLHSDLCQLMSLGTAFRYRFTACEMGPSWMGNIFRS